VVNPSVDTIYFVTVEKTQGCVASDTIRIKVNHSPPVMLGNDVSFCFGDSIVLDAGTGFTNYQWNNLSNSRFVVAKQQGSYMVNAFTIDGCRSSDTLNVLNLYPLPQPQLNDSTAICTGTQRILDAGNFLSYVWNNGSTNRYLIVTDTGKYFVTVTNSNGCKGADTVHIVSGYPSPLDFLPDDTSDCLYNPIEITANRNFSYYLWNTAQVSRSIKITTPGLYWLTVRDSNNCLGVDSIKVTLNECATKLYVPTGFTPNQDGKNDILKPILSGNIKAFDFRIYNREGQLVYSSNKPGTGWNGKLNENDQPTGVYVWICRYRIGDREPITDKGSFVLIR
jgi:gliding motility-associated-like protein